MKKYGNNIHKHIKIIGILTTVAINVFVLGINKDSRNINIALAANNIKNLDIQRFSNINLKNTNGVISLLKTFKDQKKVLKNSEFKKIYYSRFNFKNIPPSMLNSSDKKIAENVKEMENNNLQIKNNVTPLNLARN